MLSEVSSYWNNASNCAQSSAAGLLDHFGEEDVAKTFHSAFLPYGGGFKEGEVCGVISGSLAALSYILSSKNVSKDQILETSTELRDAIHQKFSSIKCYGLTQEFRDEMNKTLPQLKQEQRTRCDEVMEFVTSLANDLINKFP